MIKLVLDGQTYAVFDETKSSMLHRGLLATHDLGSADNEWFVVKKFVFWSHRIQAPIVIPCWFLTDLASVPRIFRPIISVNEKHRFAAIVHDFLYALHDLGGNKLSRRTCDLILRDFCEVYGVPWIKRQAIYLAVRTGGWLPYHRKGNRFSVSFHHRVAYKKQFLASGLDLSLKDGYYVNIE